MITESELIDKLKKGFTGSDDYLSGVNDGMFTLINHLTDQTKSMEEQLKYCHNRMAEAYSELNEKEKPLTDKIFDLANELAIEGYADEAIKMHGIHNLISNKEMRKFSRD